MQQAVAVQHSTTITCCRHTPYAPPDAVMYAPTPTTKCTTSPKFSGSYFNIEGKGELHSECHEAYQLASAPKCFFCDEPVTSAGGKFSGSSYSIEGRGKLHEECYEAFKVNGKLLCQFVI